MSGVRLGDFLPPVGHDQGDERACSSYRREHQLRHSHCVMQRECPVAPEAAQAQQRPCEPGQGRQAKHCHCEAYGECGTDAP